NAKGPPVATIRGCSSEVMARRTEKLNTNWALGECKSPATAQPTKGLGEHKANPETPPARGGRVQSTKNPQAADTHGWGLGVAFKDKHSTKKATTAAGSNVLGGAVARQ